MSVTMFGTALPIKEPFRLMQVPGIVGFHALATGVHWKTLTKMIEIAQEIDTTPRMMDAIRNPLVGKMRAYISRIEIFVSATAVT